MLTPDFPPRPGGIQVLLHRVVAGFRRIEPRVVTLKHPAAEPFDLAQDFQVRRAGVLGGARRPSVVALNALAFAEAVRFRPDVVLSGHIVASPAARAIRRSLGTPFVQYLHALEVGGRPRLAAAAVRAAASVVVVSRHTEGLALGAGALPAKIRRIPPGVDQGERKEPRAPTPTVVTVARLVNRNKGHDVMVRALPLVAARVPGVEWVIVGDGPLRPYLEELIRTHSLDGRIKLVGEVADRDRDAWLDRAHVFAMPSRLPPGGVGGEGFGIAYLEAGAHELPVVGGNVGGALDAVVDGETGLLVDPEDHVAVADAITDLLLHRERAQAMGAAGAARAREFAWPRISRQVEDLLLEVAAS